LFFYTKIGSIISIGDLPTTNIIEPEKVDLDNFLQSFSFFNIIVYTANRSKLDTNFNIYSTIGYELLRKLVLYWKRYYFQSPFF
ncbi:hypothetical protein, partial [Streptococcus mitis]|uniref:hypothetical protein n=1 Tax=Streptococcus mitis TaxID=28037 RepID=UPI001CBAD731